MAEPTTVHLSIGEVKRAFLRISRAVGKDQLQFEMIETATLFRAAEKRFRIAQVILFAEREVNLDRIERRDCCQRIAGGAHQIANLCLGQTGDAVNRRNRTVQHVVAPLKLAGPL